MITCGEKQDMSRLTESTHVHRFDRLWHRVQSPLSTRYSATSWRSQYRQPTTHTQMITKRYKTGAMIEIEWKVFTKESVRDCARNTAFWRKQKRADERPCRLKLVKLSNYCELSFWRLVYYVMWHTQWITETVKIWKMLLFDVFANDLDTRRMCGGGDVR